MIGLLKDLVDPSRRITEDTKERLIGFFAEGYSRVVIQENIRLLLQTGIPFSLHNQSLFLTTRLDNRLDSKVGEYQVVIVWDTTKATETNPDLGNKELVVGRVPTLISRTILHHLPQIKEVRLCDYRTEPAGVATQPVYLEGDKPTYLILIPYFVLHYDIDTCIIDGERSNPLCRNLKRLICAG